MSTNITCRIPIETIEHLDQIANEMTGKKNRSAFLNSVLLQYKIEINFTTRTGDEDNDPILKDTRPRKMMTFCMSRQAKDNLVTMTNQTMLSQSQIIDIMTHHTRNSLSKKGIFV